MPAETETLSHIDKFRPAEAKLSQAARHVSLRRHVHNFLAGVRPILSALPHWPSRAIGDGLFLPAPGRAQRAVHTAIDRYPAAFSVAAHFAQSLRQAERRPLRILSFGCSTGEESFTLQSYFPEDRILGCDINDAVLAVARQRQRSGDITFFHSSRAGLQDHGPFDVIFCMSSLCIFPEANRRAGDRGRFPLAAFEDLAGQIDDVLTPGGLLVLYNTSYPYRFLRTAASYETLRADILVENGFVNKLHRDGRAFTVTHQKDHARCHRVVSAPAEYLNRDFVDCIFRKRGGPAAPGEAMLSPDIPDRAHTIGRHALSDRDVFSDCPTMLAPLYEIERLKDPDGLVYEQVTFHQRDIFSDGFLPSRHFARWANTACQYAMHR